MAIFSNTRIQLRHKLSRLMNDLVTGVVSSPGSGTFVCSTTHWEKSDDYFNDFLEVFCYSGTGVGTSGNPTDWVNSTHTLTFKPAATLTASDLVELHQRFTVDEYNEAINHAIDQVANDALIDRVDQTITTASSTWRYVIPTQFLYIDAVYIADSTGAFDTKDPIDPKYWRISKESTLYLEFVKEFYTPIASRTLRIVGLASPSILDTDTEACSIDPEYILQSAKSFLHQSRIRGRDKDSEFHASQMAISRKISDDKRKEMSTNRSGRAVVEV